MTVGSEGKIGQQKEFYPKLATDNREAVPSLEIAVDEVPQKFVGSWLDELLKHTREWVDKESFQGKAELWKWFCRDSEDFMEFGGLTRAEFVCMIGLPEACRKYVANRLTKQLGRAIRYPADPLSRTEINVALCLGYIEGGVVWKSLDPCTWVRLN